MFFRTNVSPLPFRFPLCLFSLPHACPLSIHGAPAPPPYTLNPKPLSCPSLPLPLVLALSVQFVHCLCFEPLLLLLLHSRARSKRIHSPASFSSLPPSASHPNLCPQRPRPRDEDGEARQASRGGSSHTLASAPKSGTRTPIGCRHSGHAVTDEEAHVCRLQ